MSEAVQIAEYLIKEHYQAIYTVKGEMQEALIINAKKSAIVGVEQSIRELKNIQEIDNGSTPSTILHYINKRIESLEKVKQELTKL